MNENEFGYYVPMSVKVIAADDGSYTLSMTERMSEHETEKDLQFANVAALAQFWHFRKLPPEALGETLLSLHTDYAPDRAPILVEDDIPF